ncbi:MAG: hypothetical protein PHE77_01120 [Candidatus Pacebacteria bacterium]|nr:hypothetical protein [Candidatus Paceibacterota bacterium]
MEFQIAKNKISENIDVAIMRMAGYHKLLLDSAQSRQASFVKPLSLAGFPRFHVYLKETKTDYIFNLHLDQKRTVYNKAKAHQGDYDSQIIAEEVQRIKKKLLL